MRARVVRAARSYARRVERAARCLVLGASCCCKALDRRRTRARCVVLVAVPGKLPLGCRHVDRATCGMLWNLVRMRHVGVCTDCWGVGVLYR